MRPDVLVLDCSDIALLARAVRDLTDEQLAEVPAGFLIRAAGRLRAGLYSAHVAARRLEAIARSRAEDGRT